MQNNPWADPILIYRACVSTYHPFSHTHYVLLQGMYEDSIKECTKSLELNPSYTKVLVRRAEAHEKLDHLEEAIAGMCGFFIVIFKFLNI